MTLIINTEKSNFLNFDLVKVIVEKVDLHPYALTNNNTISIIKFRDVMNLSRKHSFRNSSENGFTFD